MLLEMSDSTNKSKELTRLNVKLDAALHKDLRLVSLETGEALTQLVPRLLRGAVKAEKERLHLG
jgi:hypothetical protein